MAFPGSFSRDISVIAPDKERFFADLVADADLTFRACSGHLKA
jgi:hypothetical protein